MKAGTLTILAAGTLMAGLVATAGAADRTAPTDPTRALWYQATNWVDKPQVQRYIAGSTRAYQENKQIILGTATDAAKGKNLGYLITKGVLGYPKTAR